MSERVSEDRTLDEIETLYRAALPRFVRAAAAIVGNPDTGRDVVQDAFATAVRTRASFRGEGTLEAWLWRIVINLARTRRRSERPTLDLLATDSERASWSGGYPDEEGPRLRAFVGQLPERQRLVVFLRYFADLDHAAIADALEIRPGTVAATLNAAHAAIRKRLEEVRS